jgi:hypothetical protein
MVCPWLRIVGCIVRCINCEQLLTSSCHDRKRPCK